jgi:hypothetical protein
MSDNVAGLRPVPVGNGRTPGREITTRDRARQHDVVEIRCRAAHLRQDLTVAIPRACCRRRGTHAVGPVQIIRRAVRLQGPRPPVVVYRRASEKQGTDALVTGPTARPRKFQPEHRCYQQGQKPIQRSGVDSIGRPMYFGMSLPRDRIAHLKRHRRIAFRAAIMTHSESSTLATSSFGSRQKWDDHVR